MIEGGFVLWANANFGQNEAQPLPDGGGGEAMITHGILGLVVMGPPAVVVPFLFVVQRATRPLTILFPDEYDGNE